LAARETVLIASLCYAKFTPAALHCGETVCPRRDDAEAAGRKPEFRVGDFSRIVDGLDGPIVQALGMVTG
jgi:hypothetical protein